MRRLHLKSVMDFFGGGPLGSSFWMTVALTPAAPPSHLPDGAEVTFLSAHPPYIPEHQSPIHQLRKTSQNENKTKQQTTRTN